MPSPPPSGKKNSRALDKPRRKKKPKKGKK